MTQVLNEKGGAGENPCLQNFKTLKLRLSLCWLSVQNLPQMTNDNCLFDLFKYQSHKCLMAFIEPSTGKYSLRMFQTYDN